MPRTTRAFVAGTLGLLPAALAIAQSLTGSLSGTARDEQGAAVPGASVVVTGPRGSLGTATDAAGEFRFAALDPGEYSVTLRLTGFEARTYERLAVRVGSKLALDVALKVRTVEETVDVVEQSPVVDVASSATSAGLSQDMLFSLPLNRTFGATGLLNFTPGVNNGSAFGGGQAVSNAVLLDGVDTREPFGGGAWNFFNYNVLEEVEVQGIGVPAEYGGFTGGVVNTLTRSGSNRLAGLFDLQWTTAGLSSDNVSAETAAQNPALADPAVDTKLVDLTAQVSGPLIKDHLFGFFNFQYYERISNPAGQITRIREHEPRLNGKLNFQDGGNDTLQLLVQYDQFNVEGVPGVPLLLANDALTLTEESPELIWNLQWRHVFGAKTFLEAKYVGWTSYDYLDPKVEESRHFDGATGEYSISSGASYRYDLGRNQVNASLSHHADDFLGDHDFKLGLELGRSSEHDRFHFVNDVYFYDYAGAPYLAYSYSYDLRYRNDKASVFLQDSWRAGSRLTLNLGLRHDWIRGGNEEVGHPYETRSLSPRVGLAFDLLGDKTTVLKASYGRYHESAVASYYFRALPGYTDTVVYDNSGPELVEIDRDPAVLYDVDRDIRHPRTDELSAGIERALGADLRVGLTLVARRNASFVNSVLPGARWDALTVESQLTGEPIPVYRWANRDESEGNRLITNAEGFVYRDTAGAPFATADLYRRYEAAMLVLSRRFANRWQAQASYVLSRARGTVDNDAFSSLGYSGEFESPTTGTVNRDGRLSFEARHEIKVLASWLVPKLELMLSGVFRSTTGRSYTPFQRVPSRVVDLFASGDVFLEPRGSRQVPTLNLLDLRVEKIFKVGKSRLAVYADIFNTLNVGIPILAQNRVPSVSIEGVDEPIAFGAPMRLPPARQMVVGARWSF